MSTYRKRFSAGLAVAAAGAALGGAGAGPKARAASTLLLLAGAALLGLAGYQLHHTRHERTFLRNALFVYAPYAAAALLLAAALRIWTVLAPPGRSAVAELTPARLEERLAADCARLSRLRAAAPDALAALEAGGGSPESLAAAWAGALGLYRECGQLVEAYQGFHRIDYVAHPRLHAGAFVVGLWACALQQRTAQAVSRTLGRQPALRAQLDAYTTAHGMDNATAMVRAMGSDATLLRLHAGAAYLALVGPDAPAELAADLPALRAELAALQRASGLDALKSAADPLLRLRELDRTSRDEAPRAGTCGP